MGIFDRFKKKDHISFLKNKIFIRHSKAFEYASSDKIEKIEIYMDETWSEDFQEDINAYRR